MSGVFSCGNRLTSILSLFSVLSLHSFVFFSRSLPTIIERGKVRLGLRMHAFVKDLGSIADRVFVPVAKLGVIIPQRAYSGGEQRVWNYAFKCISLPPLHPGQ